MVSLEAVKAANAGLSSSLPSGLVAVFVGATAGIGEISLKKFAQYASSPRVYFVGRTQDAGERIAKECQKLNPEGQFNFIATDVSLISKVDELCEELKSKEKTINLLFLSAGVPSLNRSKTSEGLHLLAVLNYYSRIRIINNLMPLVKGAQNFRRIVDVGGAGLEGELDETDFQGLEVPQDKLRGHLISLVTLGLETVSRDAPEVSIVHNYPGTVATRFLDVVPKEMLQHLSVMPIEESGERQLYLATSPRFPAAHDARAADADVAIGSNGKIGSGMYSIGADCELAGSAESRAVLTSLRDRGMVEKVWNHTEEEFNRITGTA
ncbi:NAD(P)-binding protein [Xylariaceae sp. FL1019]|nr:NAD(P)-binding protein [Xylariaceae sp. FL1019]